MSREDGSKGPGATVPDQEAREAQINALLDGELDATEAAALRRAAEQDRALAQAIIEAYELRTLLAELPRERAPDSLREKLQRIPGTHTAFSTPATVPALAGSRWQWLQPRWVMALAAVPLVIAIGLQRPDPGGTDSGDASTPVVTGPPAPTAAELAQARQDLALAFAYLEKAGRLTGREIEYSIGAGMRDPVKENILRTIAEQFDLNEEQDT